MRRSPIWVGLAVLVASASCDDTERVDVVLKPAVRAIDEAQASDRPPVKLEQDVVDAKPAGPLGRLGTAKQEGAKGAIADAPKGYVVMTPLARSGAFGNAILLVHPNDNVIVPIYIGGTEALSIQLRLEHRKFTRPLTHDLLDNFAAKMGARLVRSQVDSLKGGIYIGSVVFEKDGKLIQLDSRPSDAIALAIGNRVPIYVSNQVVSAAGIRPDDVGASRPDPSAEPVAL